MSSRWRLYWHEARVTNTVTKSYILGNVYLICISQYIKNTLTMLFLVYIYFVFLQHGLLFL